MKLTNLVLNNFKIYYGTQSINLDVPEQQLPTQKKNLILIGGLNGAGKTTILNSIYYVLFGKQGMSEAEYMLTFSGAINDRFFEEGGRDSSASLTFKDEEEVVTVTVTWVFDHKKTLIRENRKVFTSSPQQATPREANMTNEEYFEFINRRIPFDVAPFFIFDGEKIQELVSKQDQKIMKQSIQRIVSVEIYKELVDDLGQIQTVMGRKLSTKRIDRKLGDIEEEIVELQEKVTKAQQAAKNLDTEIKQLEDEHMRVTHERRKKLASNTDSSLQVQKRMVEYQMKLDNVKNRLETFAKNDLTKLLLAPLVKKMQVTLEAEQDYLQKKSQASMQFAPYDSFISKLLSSPVEPALTESQVTQLTVEGKHIWAELNRIRQAVIADRTIFHDVAQGTRQYLMSLRTTFPHNVRELLDQQVEYSRKLKMDEENLMNAPDPIDTQIEDDLLQEINTKLGEKRSRLKQARTVIHNNREKIENLKSQYTYTQQSVEEQSDLSKQYQLLTQIKDVAEKFVEEVTKMKAQKIKYEFKNILDHLIRKDQEFQEVEFSDLDYVVRIFNDRGAEVKLSDRSAGEKQIIALSFIWALTKTAGLKLPFVIDTPLGRLDSIHRSHIIKHYFNLLSDQVIILSTDTEITEDYYDQVNNYLVRSYELVYDSEHKSSYIREGYFDF